MTWWRRKGRESDLDREIRADLELEAEEQGETGLSAEEAYRASRRAFGNVTWVKEEVRFMWGRTLLETIFQELRYASRTLLRNPGFAMTAILTLALGIGASTAVFTVVDSVLLKPLAYHDAGRLVACWERVRFLKDDATGPNPRHVEIWRQRATAFSGLTYLRHMAVGLTMGAEHPRQTSAVTATPNFFDVLQVHALLGRTFVPGDGIRGHDDVAVLTYGLWQDLFHGDPGVIGATVRLGDVPRRVVGVLPADFHFPSGTVLRSFRRGGQTVSPAPDPAIFFPAALDVTQFTWNGNYGNWVALGRLNPGVAVAQASAQLNAIQAQILADPAYRGDRRPGALGAWVQPMQEAVVGDSRTALLLLMGSVLGLMLIACLNLANAQLGRAIARNREYAVRTALGAAKWRLAWNALAENLLVAAVGGAAGVMLAKAALDLFLRDTPVRPAAPLRSPTESQCAAVLDSTHLQRKPSLRLAARASALYLPSAGLAAAIRQPRARKPAWQLTPPVADRVASCRLHCAAARHRLVL